MKNVMEYKGYYTKIEYSNEDDVLYGFLIGINDSVSFEGASVAELRAAFHEAVDDYLDMCARYDKEPEKPYKGSFNVRVAPDLHKKLALNAAQIGVSLNQYVEMALQKCINGDYEQIQNISESLGKVATEISKKLYQSTTSMWTSVPNYPTLKKPFLRGVSKQ